MFLSGTYCKSGKKKKYTCNQVLHVVDFVPTPSFSVHFKTRYDNTLRKLPYNKHDNCYPESIWKDEKQQQMLNLS